VSSLVPRHRSRRAVHADFRLTFCLGSDTVLFPLKIYNDKGESLQDRLNANGIKTYQSTLVAEFPNFVRRFRLCPDDPRLTAVSSTRQFWIMGPNSATGHSSVLFTSEAQLALTFHLIRPIVEKLRKVQLLKPAPFVEVTTEAEDRFYAAVRKEMKKKVWEKDGGVSWYVDKATGLCSVSSAFRPVPLWVSVADKCFLAQTLYPWSQVHFWRACTFPKYADFQWTGTERPAAWHSYLGWY
jgi:hypothetical protein